MKTHAVHWRIEGTYTLTTDDDATPEAVLDEFNCMAGEHDFYAASEIDGYDVLEVDGEHVHTWVDSFGRDGEQFCLTCSKREPKAAAS